MILLLRPQAKKYFGKVMKRTGALLRFPKQSYLIKIPSESDSVGS